MKPADLKVKNKHTNRLFLLLCLIGVALVAWWAWAAGPIHSKSAVQSSQSNQGQSKLSTPGYNPLKVASPGSSTSLTPVSTSGSTVSTQPSYPVCQPRSGIQPDIAYSCDCGGPGVEIACPEPAY